MLNHKDGQPPAAGLVPAEPPAAAAGGPAATASRLTWPLDAVTMTGGLLCFALGAAMAVAWLVKATAILRFGSATPMTFDTALALAVTGAALAMLASRRAPWAAGVAGVFDAVLGLLVLAEYVLGRDLGIDQLFVRAYLTGPHTAPGRPAVNTAVCLMVAGAALLVWAPWGGRRRPAALAVAGSLIAAIALTATFGYATGTRAAYGWSRLSSMALVTAAAMLVLGLALLSAAWREAPADQGRFPRWLPLPAGVAALGLAAGVWLAISGRANLEGPNAAGATGAAVLGLLMAGLVVLAVWLAQRADTRRRAAQAEAARRAMAETQARASESRTFQFLDAVPAGVFIAAPGGQPYYANDEAERLLGRGVVPDVAAGQLPETYSVFVAGTDRPYPAEDLPVVRALGGQPSHVDDMAFHHPDGSVIPVEVWGRPVYGDDGKIEYGIVAFADMSERDAREQTIAGQAALLELAHDAIVVRDVDGRISYWSTGAEHTYGFAKADAVGRVSHELLHTQFREPLATIEATVARDGRWDGELTQRCVDGRAIVVESRWAARWGPDGSLLGFLEVNRDITARKSAERELTRKSDQVQALNATLEQQVRQRTMHLERANRNLQAFTYSVAHDLRTPLRALSGFAEALVEEYGDRLDDTGRDYAERIQAASQRMGVLIDDLLHLSRMSRAEIKLEPVDLSAEVTAIAAELSSREPGRKARFCIQRGVVVTADRNLIRSALESLLDNAWKFTSRRAEAKIEFGTTAAPDAAVCCFVRDNGAGFDPAYAGKLFQPFQRLHPVSEYPGTGVGLASVRQIVERHGGRVWAEGAVGCGTTFYFTLNTKDTEQAGGDSC